MARELGIDRVGCSQHRLRAGEIRHVGVHLAREHGVVGQPLDLRALDLAIPVRSFDQPHHEPALAALCEIDQPVDHGASSLLIRLHDEAESVPSGESRIAGKPLEQVEREIEPIGLLGVDIEPDVPRSREVCELAESRQQLGEHAVALRTRVARVQGRELDGYARPIVDSLVARRVTDRVDRIPVGDEIALGIVRGERGLAQHVVGKPIAASLALTGVGDGFGDGASGDELLAKQPHRQVDTLADQRLATLAQERSERSLER